MDKNQKRLLRSWLDAFWTEAAGNKFRAPQSLVDASFEELTSENSPMKIHWILHPRLQTFAGFISHRVVETTSGEKACYIDKVFVEGSYRHQHLAAQTIQELVDHWRRNSITLIDLHAFEDDTDTLQMLQDNGFKKVRSWEDQTLGQRLRKSEWSLDLRQSSSRSDEKSS
jgi:hypothetical protein